MFSTSRTLAAAAFLALAACGGATERPCAPNALPGSSCVVASGDPGRCSDVAGCVACASPSDCLVGVSGVVLDSRRAPVLGAKVSIAGRAAVVTGADGRFTATDVVVPYSAMAALPDGAVAGAWMGLHRADPVLALPLPSAGTFASLGTRFGGACAIAPDLADPVKADAQLLLQVDPPFRANDPVNASVGPTETCAQAAWNGATRTTGSLFVLGREYAPAPDSSFATAFPAFGRLDGVTVDHGDYTLGHEIPVAPVAAATVDVTSSGPDGVSSLEASVFFGDQWGGTGFHVADTSSAPPWPAVAIPDVAGAHAQLTARGPGTSVVRVVAPGDASADLPLAERPTLLTPLDNLYGVNPWTVFAWTPFAPGDFYRFEGSVPSPAGVFPPKPVALVVYTEETSLLLPNFSRVGIVVPGGEVLTWNVGSAGPAGGLDGITSGDHLGQALFDGIGEWDYATGWGEARTCHLIGGASIFDDWDDWD